jgi:hypothetical protein
MTEGCPVAERRKYGGETRGGGEICLFPEGEPSFYLSYEQANTTRAEILLLIKTYTGKLNALSGWTSGCEGSGKQLLYENIS